MKKSVLLIAMMLLMSGPIFALTCNERISSKYYEHCQQHCSYHLGQDACSQGTPFTNCLDDCIQDCEGFGRYEDVYCKEN